MLVTKTKFIKDGKTLLKKESLLEISVSHVISWIDDLILFDNKEFKEFMSNIYPKKLTISETSESTSVSSYLDLLCTADEKNNITTKLYDKHPAHSTDHWALFISYIGIHHPEIISGSGT